MQTKNVRLRNTNNTVAGNVCTCVKETEQTCPAGCFVCVHTATAIPHHTSFLVYIQPPQTPFAALAAHH
eukprot:1995617-Amphidinium_carterae.1